MKKAIWKAFPHLLLVILAGFICAGLEGLLSIFTMDAVDAVFSKNREIFNSIFVKLLLTATALVPVTILLAYLRGHFKRRAIVSAKSNYMKRLFDKNINEFQSDNNAKYLSILTNDTNTIETNYIDSIYEVVINLLNFIVSALVIGTVSPLALGVCLGMGILSTLVSVVISKPLQKHHRHRSELYSGYTAYIKEVLSAFHIIKSNDLGSKIFEDYTHRSKTIQDKGYTIDKVFTYINGLNRLNFSLAFYGIMIYTVYLGISGALSVGGVVLIMNNMEKVTQPISQLGEILPKIFSAKLLFAKIETSLENADLHEESLTLEQFDQEITFENVGFSFEDNTVLHGVNLSFQKGGKYLIVGPSGGGKSTLLRLLRKYYRPQDGKILVDGKNLDDITKLSYFNHLSNVEQQVFLFEDTIRNNLSLYKDFSDAELNKAIEGAGLCNFIANLPNGLDSMLYENGKNISGGERSRLAIARALLQKTELLFLDEAFSSLDSQTAKSIEKTLLSLKDITIINVSHVVFEETRRAYTKVITVKNRGVFIA